MLALAERLDRVVGVEAPILNTFDTSAAGPRRLKFYSPHDSPFSSVRNLVEALRFVLLLLRRLLLPIDGCDEH